MEASTTINNMFKGNRFFVPSYQRAYSWDTTIDKINNPKQVNVFLKDLIDYNNSIATTPYYFGHFLFDKKDDCSYAVIDGQQRLTTIVIFLSALFLKLKKIRKLSEDEFLVYENIIKRTSNYAFSTVDYDNQLFLDYVIEQSKKDNKGVETSSAKRIVNAFDYFTRSFENKDEYFLTNMLNIVKNATCSTYPVRNESEAIQMFIFQNNRGKKPSNLEIIKAQFMFNIHLYGGEEKEVLIERIKNKFEQIYKSISSIEYKINEDDVLTYSLRVFFNSLWESNAIDKIEKCLIEENQIEFIRKFTDVLSDSFQCLKHFFTIDEKKYIQIHSIISLGGISVAIPFIIKAYLFNVKIEDLCKLCKTLESIILRHRLIGTKPDLISRIHEEYQNFTVEKSDINEIINKIEIIKNVPDEEWWWAHWNNKKFELSIQGGVEHSIARFILWKYENYLQGQGKKGYNPMRFDSIECPHLEHIAPKTENEKKASGYGKYTEKFLEQSIECLGNYLLISASHNESIGNKSFELKLTSYNHLAQQREIQEMTKEDKIWNREKIEIRKKKIIKFIREYF